MRTRVKICGITRPEDGLAAARFGADAVGLVFYANSPRVVTAEMARSIVAVLPPFVTVVGLFVDAPRATIRTLIEVAGLDLLQFHGAESPENCAGFGRPYIKAVRVRATQDVRDAACRYADAQGLLLDTYSAAAPGGTGQTFDWGLIPSDIAKPLILAGGLTADNVAQGIARVRPFAVDVSGGVEASKGIKSAAKMAAFLQSVKQADDTRKTN
jgi:phosphoribosylanthranilate isomerase